MILEKYKPTPEDTWEWTLAKNEDVIPIVAMADQLFACEVDTIFTKSPKKYAHQLAMAITDQTFYATNQQLIVAKNKIDGVLMGYSWVQRGEHVDYSNDEIAAFKFIHFDLKLPVKTRFCLLAQVLQQAHLWCQVCSIPVLVSMSIRSEQKGFLKMHEEAGFTLKGSIAYMRIDNAI